MRLLTIDAIEGRILRDPGRRGVEGFARRGQLAAAARSLWKNDGAVLICTGFPVPDLRRGGGRRSPETDGPGAAKALGDALATLGREVLYATGPRTAALLARLGVAPAARIDASGLRPGDPAVAAHADACLDAAGALAHVVAVEVPGRAADGRYYGMSGADITASVCALDELLLRAAARGVKRIGVGDGGNEAGLGALRRDVAGAVPHGERIATVVEADFAIVAGTSTWGALGLVATLSLLSRRPLLPSLDEVRAGLDAILACGAVDGVSGQSEPRIDGLPIEHTLELLEELRGLAEQPRGEGLGHGLCPDAPNGR
ncbi:MAG: DUF4392 domain-containing protein [Planctomycetota bacterium]|nr:MAG: DUF4392 domain-containing protein [Planctomycetota bacterium]